MHINTFTADLRSYEIAELAHILKAVIAAGTTLEAFANGPIGRGCPIFSDLLEANDERIEAAYAELRQRQPSGAQEADQKRRGMSQYASVTAQA